MPHYFGQIDALADCGPLLILSLLVPAIVGPCSRREVTVSESKTLEYRSEGHKQWISSTAYRLDVNLFCELLFRASEDGDGIKLRVVYSDLVPSLWSNQECLDKVRVYDGSSSSSAVLGDFCIGETSEFESSGSSLLMVFDTNRLMEKSNNQTFILSYSSVRRSEKSSTIDVGTLGVIIIAVALVSLVMGLVIYKRWKYAQWVNSRLEQSRFSQGHGAPTLRGRAHIGPTHTGQNIYVPEVVSDVNQSFRPPPSQILPRTGRVRHPAGDTCHYLSQQSQSLIQAAEYSSGYSWDGELTQCGEALDSGLSPPVFLIEPSGASYAGGFHENEGLCPPDDNDTCYRVSPAALSEHVYSDYDDRTRSSNHNQLVEKLLSSQSLHNDVGTEVDSGRSSPSNNRLHSTVLIHNGRPELVRRGHSEGQTLTFYGLIDGAGASYEITAASATQSQRQSSETETSHSEMNMENRHSLESPPSNVEAASGKYLHFDK